MHMLERCSAITIINITKPEKKKILLCSQDLVLPFTRLPTHLLKKRNSNFSLQEAIISESYCTNIQCTTITHTHHNNYSLDGALMKLIEIYQRINFPLLLRIHSYACQTNIAFNFIDISAYSIRKKHEAFLRY